MQEFRFDRAFVRNTGLSAVSAFCTQGALAFVVNPYLKRHLGNERLGHFLLAMSIVHFLFPVLMGAMTNSLLRQHRDVDSGKRGGFWLTGTFLMTGIGVLCGLAMVATARPLARRWNAPDLAVWLPALVPYTVGSMIYFTQRVQMTAALAYGRMVVYDLLFGLGLLVVPLGCRLGWLGDWWPLWMSAAPLLAGTGATAQFVRRGEYGLSGTGPRTARRILDPMSIYLLGLVGVYLARYADRWILGEAGLPGEEIAYYAVAIQAAYLVLFPFEHVSAVLVSYFSNVRSLDEIERREVRRYFYALALSMVGFVVGAMPLGYVYMRYFFGPEYLRAGAPVFGVTVAGLAVYMLQMFGRGIIVRFHHPVTDPIIQWVFGAAGLLLAWLLIRPLGGMGAALGRNVSFVLVGLSYFVICEAHLFRRAFLLREEPRGQRQ